MLKEVFEVFEISKGEAIFLANLWQIKYAQHGYKKKNIKGNALLKMKIKFWLFLWFRMTCVNA